MLKSNYKIETDEFIHYGCQVFVAMEFKRGQLSVRTTWFDLGMFINKSQAIKHAKKYALAKLRNHDEF